MRILALVIVASWFHRRGLFAAVIDETGEAYPQLFDKTGRETTEAASVATGGTARQQPRQQQQQTQRRSGDGDGTTQTREDETTKFNERAIDYGRNVSRGLLMAQYERCLRSNGFLDCFKFKTFKFVRDLLQTKSTSNISAVARALGDPSEPLLVGLPLPNGTRTSLLSSMVRRSFPSGSAWSDTLQFVAEQLDNFILGHGVVVTVKNARSDMREQLDEPWLLEAEEDEQSGKRREIRSERGKIKKKEYAIIFPMLVLFKFLKIKMLLVPILIGVVFLKKLIILTLTLMPYMIGLVGCCRRAPFIGAGFQNAGILQEIDTRGEFSSNYGYTFPYRNDFLFRQKDRGRPADGYNDY